MLHYQDMEEQAYPCPLAKDKNSKGYFSDSLSYVAAEPQLRKGHFSLSSVHH